MFVNFLSEGDEKFEQFFSKILLFDPPRAGSSVFYVKKNCQIF